MPVKPPIRSLSDPDVVSAHGALEKHRRLADTDLQLAAAALLGSNASDGEAMNRFYGVLACMTAKASHGSRDEP